MNLGAKICSPALLEKRIEDLLVISKPHFTFFIIVPYKTIILYLFSNIFQNSSEGPNVVLSFRLADVMFAVHSLLPLHPR